MRQRSSTSDLGRVEHVDGAAVKTVPKQGEKPAPTSLFVRERSTPIRDPRALFKRLTEHTPQRQFDEIHRIALNAADTAEVDPCIGQGKRYASDIREFSALAKHAASQGDAYESANWTARMVQAWMMLRMDVVAAAPVRREQRRIDALVKTKKPARAEIAEALASSRTRAQAAAKLGCSKRQLQRWLNVENLR